MGMPFVFTVVIIVIVLIIFSLWLVEKQKAIIRKQIEGLANNSIEMSPQEFMELRKKSFGGRGRPSYALTMNFAGCLYII